MEDKQKTEQTDDLASRIEKTLAQRERERVDRQQETLSVTDPERERSSSQYFSYLMLFLGIVVGSVIGAMLYFIVPGAGSPMSKSTIALDALVEADQLLRSGRIDSARKAYLGVIADYPDSPQPYNNLAALYAAEGDFEQAQTLLNKALETDPNYLTIYKNVGMIYAAMARDSYGKALQLKGQQQQVNLQMLGAKSQQPVLAQDQKEQTPTVAVKPVAVKPVAVKPVAVKPVAVKPVAVKPVAVKPVAVKPVAVKPVAVKPVAVKPVAVKPVAVKPVAVKPVAVKPVAVKPVAVKPVAVKPVAVKPVAVKPVAVKPVAVKPVAVTKPLIPQDLAISDPGASLSPQQFLLDWAREWSAQDVDGYLGSYAAEFKPEGSSSRRAWTKKRRQRLTAPKFIKIKLESIELVSGNDKLAEVRLIQSYRSDRFRDRTRKSFILKRAGQSWLITEERSLGQVR